MTEVITVFDCSWLQLTNKKIFLVSTTWKLCKYGVFSCPCFSTFGLNTVIYSVCFLYLLYLLCKSPHSVRIPENIDQEKLQIWILLTQLDNSTVPLANDECIAEEHFVNNEQLFANNASPFKLLIKCKQLYQSICFTELYHK